VVFIEAPRWSIPDELVTLLPEGVSWRGPVCFAKQGPVVVGVDQVIPATTPRHVVEAEARRLLKEAVAEHDRLSRQSITLMRARLIEMGIDPDEVLSSANDAVNPEPGVQPANKEQ
jgi:hypothetical protein